MPIEQHHCHIELEENVSLWRYMSLTKYESLLEKRALFFCRADKFSDPYECSIPKREFDHRISPNKFEDLDRAFGRPIGKFNLKDATQKAEGTALVHKKFKTATTVNCWHINNSESDAMWQLYLKDNEGVAIQTTKPRLYKALTDTTEKIGVSKVRYINYDTDIWYHPVEFPVNGYNFFTPLIHKKIEFKHEQELRLYHHKSDRESKGYWETQTEKKGEFIQIAPEKLIDTVIFHPTADQSSKERIINLTRAYAFDFKFKDSSLSSEPLF